MRAATSTLTARLIAEWMSFVGWLHTAVRKDSRALALFADTEDLADEAGGALLPRRDGLSLLPLHAAPT
jgi:hypothetical protein